MNRSSPPIRRATRDDHDAIVRVLARAFDRDPVVSYLLRHDEHRARAIELCFGAFLRHMTMPHGETWVAEGGLGAALWTPPGRWDLGVFRMLAMGPALLTATGITRFPTMALAALGVHKLHPRAPHYYLFAIGVDPEHQGRGIGSALLREVLPRCDSERMPAYLEASTPENARLYERHGFELTREVRMTADAPPVRLMWREPRPENRSYA